MAVTITTDPIVTEALVTEILGWSGDEARLAINSVSARFLKYTGRSRITEGSTTQNEALPPSSVPVLFLRASPVASITTIKTLYDGDDDETLTTDDYELDDTTGRLVLPAHNVAGTDHRRRLEVTYTGGWSTVPGDLQESALQLMVLDKRRREGMVGASSATLESTVSGTTFNIGNVPPEVKDVWDRYRIY